MVVVQALAHPLLSMMASDENKKEIIEIGLPALRVTALALPGMVHIQASTGELSLKRDHPPLTTHHSPLTTHHHPPTTTIINTINNIITTINTITNTLALTLGILFGMQEMANIAIIFVSWSLLSGTAAIVLLRIRDCRSKIEGAEDDEYVCSQFAPFMMASSNK